MTNNIKLFLAAIFVGVSLAVSVNLLHSQAGSFFYVRELNNNPLNYLSASIVGAVEKQSKPSLPTNCPIEAKSVLIIELDQNGKQTIIFRESADKKMPIASLTKLMTAAVADEFYENGYKIKISKNAIATAENIGFLKEGEYWSVEDLLKMALVESSNDAAVAIAQPASINGFVEIMNLKAKELGMKNTYFYNPTGLEEKGGTDENNYSTAYDLAKLVKYLLDKTEILDITILNDYPMYTQNGIFHHTLTNTNELITEGYEIIGSKTGYTKSAGGCLITVTKTENNVIRINIILNSTNRFSDTRKLLTCQSFK